MCAVCRLRMCLLCCLSHGSRSTHLLPLCMCRVSYCRQSPRWLLRLLEKHLLYRGIMMNAVSDVAAAQTTSTGSSEDEKSAQSLKVRACMRTLSARIRSVTCSPMCLRASSTLPGYPALIPIFFGDHPCTTRQAASMLVERIGDGRALHPCGQGGASVRETVPERLGAPRARCGRFR